MPRFIEPTLLSHTYQSRQVHRQQPYNNLSTMHIISTTYANGFGGFKFKQNVCVAHVEAETAGGSSL